MACVDFGIERAGRLVHEDDLGLDGERAREAEALLLADGKRERRAAQAVLHFVPERGFARGRARRAAGRSRRVSERRRFAPKRTFSAMLVGKTTGCWKSMPIRARNAFTSTPGA